MLGTLESEHLKVTALNLFHPIVSSPLHCVGFFILRHSLLMKQGEGGIISRVPDLKNRSRTQQGLTESVQAAWTLRIVIREQRLFLPLGWQQEAWLWVSLSWGASEASGVSVPSVRSAPSFLLVPLSPLLFSPCRNRRRHKCRSGHRS